MTYDDAAALLARALAPHADLAPGDPVAPAITPTSTYHLPGEPGGRFQYGRYANPTWDALEDTLAALEGAPVLAVPSGMAAVAAVLQALLKVGDTILLPSDGYFASRAFADRFIRPIGITVRTCPTREQADADLAGCRLVWVETPSNPGLDLCDIAAVAARAHAAGALLVVDNTTMTPLGQRPLDLGADLVVSADTKAINGHSDTLFGHVAARDPDVLAALHEWRRLGGSVPGTFEAWQVLRGLATLEVRFDRMCRSAQVIAERLAVHPKVRSVVFPGLPGHPDHALAERQMLRAGFLVGLTLADTAMADRFMDGARLLRQATSFGGTHSSAERRARWGDPVPGGFVRLSVGCEPVELLWHDLAAALDQA